MFWKLRADDHGEIGSLHARDANPRAWIPRERPPVDPTAHRALLDPPRATLRDGRLGDLHTARVDTRARAEDVVVDVGVGWDRPPAPVPPRPSSPSTDDAEDVEDAEAFEFELIPPPRVSSGVVNLQEVDPNKDDHPKWMRDMWSEKVSAVSRDVIEAELESRLESVPPELSHVKPGEDLFVTFGTKSVEDFIVTWLESAERLGLSPLFVGALDEDMHAFCKRRGVPSMLLKGNSVLKNRVESFIKAGDESFKKMGTVKTKFVQDLLEIGVAPILTDADVVWLRDPRPYFRRGTYAVADALVSTDCIDVPADKADKNGCSHVNFNTGVLHFRPTDAAKAFVQTWKTKVATSTIAWMRDQPAFNLITHEGVGGHSLVPAVRVPSHKRGADGHRMVYYAANATLRLGVLPNWLFGNGHTYFVQWHHLARPEDGEPYSVHMTYQYGDTGEYAYGKRERMRQAGIWRADPPSYYSEGHFLVVSDEGARSRFPGDEEVGTDREAYKTAIRRHLDEDALRRETVRNALALASALGRILVLPAARCYCDKIWNNLNACRAPGSETFRLPYACPMDHIYDLPRWFRDDMPPFREPGFLRDARVPEEVRASTGRVVVDRGDDSRAGVPSWADDSASEHAGETVVRLPRGFTAEDARTALRSLADTRVIEVDYLGGEGTFCGFGSGRENLDFDARVGSALEGGGQYYCMTELWEDMGAPRSGRAGTTYEPQVVKRHCGHMEEDFKRMGRVHPGRVEHIDRENPDCSCEWGFGSPRPLAHVAKDPNLCPKTAGETKANG